VKVVAMVEIEKVEEQIGEVLGLEIAAQKAVEELSLKGLLDKRGIKGKLQDMKSEAAGHQKKIEKLMQRVSESEGLNQDSIRQHAEEASEKASQMMQTYLGEDPDTLDALEFLCLAEGGEVTRYEVLSEIAKELKEKKVATEIRSILKEEEKEHLKLCTQLAKENSTRS
jgi:ferritin-like metal-binding protein YciE